MIEQLVLAVLVLLLLAFMWGLSYLCTHWDEMVGEEDETTSSSVVSDSSTDPNDPDRTPVEIEYTNWKGERSTRLIYVYQFYWGVSEYHPTPGYLIHGWDLEKQATRTFSMKGIHSWKEVTS